MGYKLNAGTIDWAEKRSKELLCGEINVGVQVEKTAHICEGLREAADQMDDQPESDMIRSIADDLEKMFEELKARHREISKERLALGNAIIRYRRG